MKSARVSELKASLSSYLARVKRGEEVLVTERGRPIAKLVPLGEADMPEGARAAALERAGLVRQGTGSLPPGFWRRRRPRDPKGRVRAALLEERDTGR